MKTRLNNIQEILGKPYQNLEFLLKCFSEVLEENGAVQNRRNRQEEEGLGNVNGLWGPQDNILYTFIRSSKSLSLQCIPK